jgi:hypothetical protein
MDETKQKETLQLETAQTRDDYIDPVIEKRVVRKLDIHVTLLVGGLCMSNSPRMPLGC